MAKYENATGLGSEVALLWSWRMSNLSKGLDVCCQITREMLGVSVQLPCGMDLKVLCSCTGVHNLSESRSRLGLQFCSKVSLLSRYSDLNLPMFLVRSRNWLSISMKVIISD